MTILNWHCSDEAALVCVDTLIQRADGSRCYGSKIAYVAHSNVVIGVRGPMILGHVLALTAVIDRKDWDDLFALWPQMLADASKAIGENASEMEKYEELAVGAQVVLIGYSAKAGGFQAAYSERQSLADGFGEIHLRHACYAPWELSWGEIPLGLVHSPKSMSSIATRQVELGNQLLGDRPLGGKLLIAHMSRNETRFSTQECGL